MAVRSGDVRAGKCFVAISDGQIRRVLRVRDDVVTFEARKAGRNLHHWSASSVEALSAFLEQVLCEVGSDYIPNRNSDFLYA